MTIIITSIRNLNLTFHEEQWRNVPDLNSNDKRNLMSAKVPPKNWTKVLINLQNFHFYLK